MAMLYLLPFITTELQQMIFSCHLRGLQESRRADKSPEVELWDSRAYAFLILIDITKLYFLGAELIYTLTSDARNLPVFTQPHQQSVLLNFGVCQYGRLEKGFSVFSFAFLLL